MVSGTFYNLFSANLTFINSQFYRLVFRDLEDTEKLLSKNTIIFADQHFITLFDLWGTSSLLFTHLIHTYFVQAIVVDTGTRDKSYIVHIFRGIMREPVNILPQRGKRYGINNQRVLMKY